MIHIMTLQGDRDTKYDIVLATTRKLTKSEMDMLDAKVTAYKARNEGWNYGGIQDIFRDYAKEQGIYVPIRHDATYGMEQ
jgi:hypothetical protein